MAFHLPKPTHLRSGNQTGLSGPEDIFGPDSDSLTRLEVVVILNNFFIYKRFG